jgi:hypothetical protein
MTFTFPFSYERPVTEARKAAAEKAGMEPAFFGNFTLFLTPMHVLFIICYVILCVDSLVFGVLSAAVREKMKLVIRRRVFTSKSHHRHHCPPYHHHHLK